MPPDTPSQIKPSQASTFLMTPAQHRRQAEILREKFPNDPETPQLADQHEKIAAAIEREQPSQ